MKHAGKAAIAASTFAATALLSFGWTDHGSVSLSVESAQARVVRASPRLSASGVAHRHAWRGVYGAGLAGAAALGAAAAIAGAPYYGRDYSYSSGPYYGQGYYSGNPYSSGGAEHAQGGSQ